MVTQLKKKKPAAGRSGSAREPLAGTVKDSAQQIWLAGLGAFSKAQAEGGKVFEALVREGLALQRKTQSVAEERLTEATSRMASMASVLSSRASGQWDRLESIFEERVARALGRLGVPSARDVDALMARIDALSRAVERLGGKPARPAAKTRPAAKAAGKAAAKQPARKAAKRASPRKPAA